MDTSSDDSVADSDPAFGQLNRMYRLSADEGDRGLVLSLAAFAEEALGRLLRQYLRPGNAAAKLLDGFNAPLGSFAARIKAATALGLLTENQHSDLELTRKVRNRFAHNWGPCLLSEQAVVAIVERMSGDRFLGHPSDSPRERFRTTVFCALAELESLNQHLKETARCVPSLGRELNGRSRLGGQQPEALT